MFAGSSKVPDGTMLTSYEMGRVKTFLHPLEVVMTVVLVVTVEEAVFCTAIVSRDVVLEISKTFSGARSRGRRIVLVPDSAHSSTRMPSVSSVGLLSFPLLLLLQSDDDKLLLFSPLASESPDVKLDTDVWVPRVDTVDISVAIKAARTSGANDDQASKMDDGSIGAMLDDSSLQYKQKQKRGFETRFTHCSPI